jgi:hypothetical protein
MGRSTNSSHEPVANVRAMKAKSMGATEIAKALQIGRASVYRGAGGRIDPTTPACPFTLRCTSKDDGLTGAGKRARLRLLASLHVRVATRMVT